MSEDCKVLTGTNLILSGIILVLVLLCKEKPTEIIRYIPIRDERLYWDR